MTETLGLKWPVPSTINARPKTKTDIPNVRPPDPRERRERRSETLRTVADIWRNVAANRDSVRQP